MFTKVLAPNPNLALFPNLPAMVKVDACGCGSTRVVKRYTNDASGEVDGVDLRCLECGNHETF